MEEKENSAPHSPSAKKRRLSLSLKKKGRFAESLQEEEMTHVWEAYTPDNTSKSTQWAVRVFYDRCSGRAACPSDLLESPVAEKLDYWLSHFAVECRREDGEPYPSTILYQLLAGLLRYARSKSSQCLNFPDKRDPRFQLLRGACQTISKSLWKTGIRAEVKHASIFTPEEEDLLWSSGAIGTHSPQRLARILPSLLLEHCFSTLVRPCVSTVAKSSAIKAIAVSTRAQPDCYVYVENGSKNYQGAFRKNNENKIVHLFRNEKASNRCPVYLLDFYFSKLLSMFARRHELFVSEAIAIQAYWWDKPWFSSTPIGRNTLAKMKVCAMMLVLPRRLVFFHTDW